MNVAQILKTKGNKVISVSSSDSVLHALEVLKENRIGALMVIEPSGKVSGVLSERDVVRALPAEGGNLLVKPVSSLMTEKVISCSPDQSIEEVLEAMTAGRFRHMPVMDGKKLVGVISIGDAVKARIDEAENEAKALKNYIASG